MLGQPKMKKTLAIKNPVFLKRNSLKLERDSLQAGKYYIKFKYDALVDFTINILTNATELKPESKDSRQLFISPEDSQPLTFQGFKGQEVEFLEEGCLVNIEDLLARQADYHIVIEMVPKIKTNDPVAFYTLCKILEERTSESSYRIKIESQRLLAQGMYMEVHEIFSSTREMGECLICFEKTSNTILLPCKHSCCSNCAHGLRMRNLPCPMCKNSMLYLLRC